MPGTAAVDSRPERVPQPFHGMFAIGIRIDADDIEASNMAVERTARREEHCRGFHELDLLASVDGQGGIGESRCAPVPDLDENQAVTVEHNEIDLTVPTTEIGRDPTQPLRHQETGRMTFGVAA